MASAFVCLLTMDLLPDGGPCDDGSGDSSSEGAMERALQYLTEKGQFSGMLALSFFTQEFFSY